MSLNLLPLVTQLNQKSQMWKQLPLSLLGCINLLKMKFLRVILYFLWKPPVWVPKSFFHKLNSIFGSFLWLPQSPRIGIKVLQEPWGQGGLALPDWQKYYLTGQMVLDAAQLGSYESLRLALYRGPKSSLPLTVSMKVTIKAWEVATNFPQLFQCYTLCSTMDES